MIADFLFFFFVKKHTKSLDCIFSYLVVDGDLKETSF